MITTCVYRNGRPELTDLRVPASLTTAAEVRAYPAIGNRQVGVPL